MEEDLGEVLVRLDIAEKEGKGKEVEAGVAGVEAEVLAEKEVIVDTEAGVTVLTEKGEEVLEGMEVEV